MVPVSSPATAEMVKILENTFRAVNIGFVNEMAQICHRIGIDIWEVIAAASTKPFGYMPFHPGPGLGVQTRFIELADTINSGMPLWWVGRIQYSGPQKLDHMRYESRGIMSSMWR